MAVSTAVLFSGFATQSVYAKVDTTRFETPFESSLIPACSSEEVFFKGVAGFTIQESTDKDGNLRQVVKMDYEQTKGVTASGTEYIVHERDASIFLIDGSSGTTTFGTLVKGSFVAKGSEINTHLMIKLITTIDENGDPHTIVDDVVVKCQG